jgi:hypothetical protein
MLKLLEFDYHIEYKKGKDNSAADALSRQFQDEDTELQLSSFEPTCHQITVSVPKRLQEVQESYAGDEECTKLIQELTIDVNIQTNYSLQVGILRFKGKIYVGSTTSLRDKVFYTFHSSIFRGHSGIKVTLHKI